MKSKKQTMEELKLQEQKAEDRDKALFSFDRDQIEAYAKKYGVDAPKDDRVFWGGVSMAILNIEYAPEDVKKKAADKLEEMGMSPSLEIML